ncbi:MAG: hypothetical protein FJ279_16875, partial [Planctomycetes bacterium]|nr:hypothetical protein [Planctomycetota bacterium]
MADGNDGSTINHQPSTMPSDGFAPVVPTQLDRASGESQSAGRRPDPESEVEFNDSSPNSADVTSFEHWPLELPDTGGAADGEWPVADSPRQPSVDSALRTPNSALESPADPLTRPLAPSVHIPDHQTPTTDHPSDSYAGPFLALEDAPPAQRAQTTLQGLSTQELRDLIAQVRASQVSETNTEHPTPTPAASPENPEPRTQDPVPQAKGSVAHRVSAAEAATEGVHQQAALAVAAASTERVSLGV